MHKVKKVGTREEVFKGLAERTAGGLKKDDINENHIKDHEIILLEGYLWDKGASEEMFKYVIRLAKKKKKTKFS